MKLLNNLLWILPFFCFILGYQILNQLSQATSIPTPNLVGLSLANALKITSNLKLNLRIISEQVDQELPEDTILSQKPACQFIKTNQVIFIVVAKKPTTKITPDLYGLTSPEVGAKLNSQNLNFKAYELPNLAPNHTCFAQNPTANQNLNHLPIITYFSTNHHKLVIMPTLTGLPISDIKSFLAINNLKLKIKYLEDFNLPKNTIIEQKPTAGTIINLNKITEVELFIA